MKRIKWFLLLWYFFLMPVHALRFSDGMEYETTSDSTVTLYRVFDRDTLIVPDKVTYNSKTYAVTGSVLYNLGQNARKIVLPASFRGFTDRNGLANNVNTFEVDSQNPFFTSINGILYSKDSSRLYAYPAGRTDTVFSLPPGVEMIKEYAFSGNRFLKKIQNVQFADSIEKGAFMKCENLIAVEFHPKLRTIADDLFSGCVRLNSIQIPNSVKIIGNSSFAYNALQSVQLPDSLLVIGHGAFYYCKILEKIEFPCGLLKLGSLAFGECKKLKSVFIPQNVRQIWGDSFGFSSVNRINVHRDNKTICSVRGVLYNKDKTILVAYPPKKRALIYFIPKSTKEVFGGVFQNASNLRAIYMSNGVQKIGFSCFSNCESLLKIRLSSKLKVIDSYAFNNCSNLRSLRIPDSVQTIRKFAFLDCKKLRTVILPKSLDSITSDVFRRCESLKSIHVKKGNNNYSSRDGVLYVNNMTELMKYPQNKSGAMLDIPNSVKIIQSFSFERIKKLQTLIVPESVYSIGGDAFYYCKGLRKVVFEGHLNSLPQMVFYGCGNLKEVSLPKGLTEIPDYAFSGCVSLQKVDLSEDISKIGLAAFFGCKSLQQISFPANVYAISEKAFYGCSSLSKVDLPEKLKVVSPNTFQDCNKLQEVRFPESIQSVQEYAFRNCKLLKKIQLPKSCSFVGLGAFAGCTGLESVVLKNPNPFILLDNTFENVSRTGFRIEVPKGSLADYLLHKSWSAVFNIVESNP